MQYYNVKQLELDIFYHHQSGSNFWFQRILTCFPLFDTYMFITSKVLTERYIIPLKKQFWRHHVSMISAIKHTQITCVRSYTKQLFCFLLHAIAHIIMSSLGIVIHKCTRKEHPCLMGLVTKGIVSGKSLQNHVQWKTLIRSVIYSSDIPCCWMIVKYFLFFIELVCYKNRYKGVIITFAHDFLLTC